MELTESEKQQIAELLTRRANEVAGYKGENRDAPSGVEFALSREIERLRRLASRVNPPKESAEDE